MFFDAKRFSMKWRSWNRGFVVWLLAPFVIASLRCFGQIPSITLQPASQTIFFGDPVTFQVAANGGAPLSYQWFKDDTAVPAATAATLNLPTVGNSEHGARFWVRVTNTF